MITYAKLLVCEKFSAAQDIASALGCPRQESNCFTGSGLCITWLDGHLLKLADPEYYKSEWMDRAIFPVIPLDFIYTPRDKKAKTQLAEVAHLVDLSSEIINACDAGREGEFIFSLFWEYIGRPKKTLNRLWLHSNTTSGIKAGWASLEDALLPKYTAMAVAAKARNQADWLLGINGSRAVTKLIGTNKWSVGRVQTSVLGMVFDRDKRIKNFRSVPYYSLYAKFDGRATYESKVLVTPDFKRMGKHQHIFAEEQEAVAMEYLVRKASSGVWDVKDSTTSSALYPYSLFDLSALQKFCAYSLGWSAARTLAAAQDAYSAEKAISYPRTDSNFLPEDFISVIDDLYKTVWLLVQEEVPSIGPLDMPLASTSGMDKRFVTFDDSKVSDHYAIIPTGIVPRDPKSDAMLIWRVVARRFLLHFFAPAKLSKFSRLTTLNYILTSPFLTHRTGDIYPLAAITNVESLVDPGWTTIATILGLPLPETLPLEKRFPKPELDGVKFDKIEFYQGYTDAPDPFFEDTLLSAMDSEGLGTPATQASVLETLVYRDYVIRHEGRPPKLRVAPNGELLMNVLVDKGLSFIAQPELTAEWELSLFKIESNAVDAPKPEAFLLDVVRRVNELCDVANGAAHEVYCPLSKMLVTIDEATGKINFPGLPFPLPIIFAGRTMSSTEYRDVLLSKTGVGPFDGFISKMGKSFSAKLIFDPATGKISFKFKK